MAIKPSDHKPEKARPKIWATGGQRPPFDIRALGRASLFFAREGVAPLHAWIARTGRRAAVNVRDGAGRIPEAKLGRVAPYVPSHLRVAMWIKNCAAIHAHASASADPDVKRGNDLVAAIEPHLWPLDPQAAPAPDASALSAEPEPVPERAPKPAPVVLPEPEPEPKTYDPLASIRGDIDPTTVAASQRKTAVKLRPSPELPKGPPPPPGQLAATAIQVIGWLIGWGTAILALPYGLIRALWVFARGQDLRKIGAED
jgi:hypothetical protein